MTDRPAHHCLLTFPNGTRHLIVLSYMGHWDAEADLRAKATMCSILRDAAQERILGTSSPRIEVELLTEAEVFDLGLEHLPCPNLAEYLTRADIARYHAALPA